MSAYYYLLSSLPSLFFEQAAPLGLADFQEAASRWLSVADAEILAKVDAEFPPTATGSSILDAYIVFEWGVRNALVRQRALKTGFDVNESLRLQDNWHDGVSFANQEVARLALAASNPLEAEMIIEHSRWKIVEDLEIGHHFDLEKVLAYRLKLGIVERRGRLNLAAGQELYTVAYEHVARSIPLDLE